nr:collagen alpha-1(I) chain-like [Anas platyrhynchos]
MGPPPPAGPCGMRGSRGQGRACAAARAGCRAGPFSSSSSSSSSSPRDRPFLPVSRGTSESRDAIKIIKAEGGAGGLRGGCAGAPGCTGASSRGATPLRGEGTPGRGDPEEQDEAPHALSRLCGFWGTWAGSWGATGCGRPPPVPVPAPGMLCVCGAGGLRHPLAPLVPWFFGVRSESPLGWVQPPAPTMALVPSMSPSPPPSAPSLAASRSPWQQVPSATAAPFIAGTALGWPARWLVPVGHRAQGMASRATVSPRGARCSRFVPKGHGMWLAQPGRPHGVQGVAVRSPWGAGRRWHGQGIALGCRARPRCPHGVHGMAVVATRSPWGAWHSCDVPMGCMAQPGRPRRHRKVRAQPRAMRVSGGGSQLGPAPQGFPPK